MTRISLVGCASALLVVLASVAHAQSTAITTPAGPGRLEVRHVTDTCLRVTLKPISSPADFPTNPALAERDYEPPSLSLFEIDQPVRQTIGGLIAEVSNTPLTLSVSNTAGRVIQQVTFEPDGTLSFLLDDRPVLGLGEGGPLPARGVDWRSVPVEFDRRGRLHRMRPRWQADAYGSRNPVPLLIGVRGWGLYVVAPWGSVDLSEQDRGIYKPLSASPERRARQDHANQRETLGKGVPPLDAHVEGLVDLFIFDAAEPTDLMRDLALISGQAVMPPRWALGYMQSHRTLEDDAQMVGIVHTFRAKQIPLDAVIYLGTGFTPRGWNRPQPSFEPNPEVIQRPIHEVIDDLHALDAKVALHMVPWDRDKLPTLEGNIPPEPDETLGPSHIAEYWREHTALVDSGVDAWWPDEGDWFDLHERMKRHQLYYEGPLSTQPNRRPWSLHRNGHLGVARWGGWVWSGDTHSSWKTLEAQIAVGLNHSLSLSPFWGSDIGGFLPTRELTGELYARWFQFGAFCPSFRAHGRTWWTRLPWGWGLGELGPVEFDEGPDLSELNNPAIEQIVKRYAELRYQLLSYNYTLAWQSRRSGMPMMRAMWLHYPEDPIASGLGDQYLWGRDLLIAPVYEKGATERRVYLPVGDWYDWWSGEKHTGGQWITRTVDLATMPIYARAGAIIPIDPIRQHTAEQVDEPLTVRVYRGADGRFTLYDDDGVSLEYLEQGGTETCFVWDDELGELSIKEINSSAVRSQPLESLQIEVVPDRIAKQINVPDRHELRTYPIDQN